MPKIPTYTAQLSRGNINPVQGNPSSAAMPYNALAQVGESISQTAQVFGMVAEKRKQQDDITAADKLHNETRFKLDDFLQANQNSTTLAEDFKQYGESLVSESVSSLPSDNARKMFQSRAMDDVARRYGSALDIGERNRLNNAKIEIQQSSVDATTSYRTLYNLDPEMANESIRKDLDSQLVQIERGFGGIAPANAAALKNSVTLDVITGVMESSPQTALEMIDEYPIDEQQRRILRSQAEAKVATRDALQVQQFQQSVQDSLATAQLKNEVAIQPRLDTYKLALKDDRAAEAQYNKDKVEFDVHNKAVFVIDGIQGKSPEFISAQLGKIQELGSGEVDKRVYDAAAKMAANLIKERDHDPAAYVRKYNPAIQELEAAKVGATPAKAVALERDIASTILRYQGPPPPPDFLGNKVHDHGYYQNLPSHQQSVLTKTQASSYAASINQGTPNQQVDALAQFDASFTSDTKDIAWRDLTRLPKGEAVGQEAQMVMLHLGKPYVRQLASAIRNVNDNVKNKGVKLEDYEQELTSNADWKDFQSSFTGDNTQNAADVAGFRSAVVAYAVALPEKSAGKSVKLAIDTLIKSKFYYSTVGDQRLPFAKGNGPGGSDLTDEEMEFTPSAMFVPAGPTQGITTSVREKFDNLDFSNVKTVSPEGINLFPSAPPGVSKETLASFLNTQLATEKMLVPSEDGKGFYVYMRNQALIPTQLFTTDNKPMFIPYFDQDRRLNAPQKASSQRITTLEGYTTPIGQTPKYNPASPSNRQ